MYSNTGILGFDVAQMQLGPAIGITFLVIVISYCRGMISPATMIASSKGIDIRKEGSGNPGTTNTLRVMGKKAALVVLLVDVFKGVIAVAATGILIGHNTEYVAAVCVFLGHVFPANKKFNGGKGVATAFGALTAVNLGLGFGCLGIVVFAVLLTRYVSMGSVAGAIACPVLTWLLVPDFIGEAIFMGMIVLLRHKDNIKRLANHEESKLSFKK